HYPENRRDESYSLLANVDEMRKSGAKTKGILFYLREMSDVQRAEAFLRDVCANDSGSRAYIYMDDDTIAEAVVFQTRKLRRLFSAFSDVMMVNMAFGTNRNRYKLFSFLVHNFNDDYDAELLRVGTRALDDDELASLERKHRNELEKLANIINSHAFELTSVQFKYALGKATNLEASAVTERDVTFLSNETGAKEREKVEEMVVRRETRQGNTAFMKRLQAFHVGDRPRLMMEHHAFLAGERSTDADFTTAEPATVATERPAAPLAPEARLNRPQPMGKYAAYLLRNKQLLSQQRRAVAAKTLAGSGKKRLMQKKKQSTRPGDQATRIRMTKKKKKMETTKNVKGKAVGKAKAASKAPAKASSAFKKPHKKSTKTLAKEARGQRQLRRKVLQPRHVKAKLAKLSNEERMLKWHF
ncbi:hypothetical protein JG688_00014632, partial [Phytophthora aleatoria]